MRPVRTLTAGRSAADATLTFPSGNGAALGVRARR